MMAAGTVSQSDHTTSVIKEPTIAIIDGSNVAYQGQKGPRLRHLMAVVDEVRRYYPQLVVIADANLRHKIDDKQNYEALQVEGIICQAPAGIRADSTIIETVNKLMRKGQKVVVISNDLGIGRCLPDETMRISIFSVDIGADTEVMLFPIVDPSQSEPVDMTVGP